MADAYFMSTNAVALSRVLIAERPSLIRLARRIVGSEPAAEDIAQAAWLRIQRVEDDPPISDKRGFLYRLVLNLAADQRRAARRRDKLLDSDGLPDDVPSLEPSAEAVMVNRDLLARMRVAIEGLPPRCRQVFVMRNIDGMTPAQIAEALGITTNMVAKHVCIALQHCLDKLEADPLHRLAYDRAHQLWTALNHLPETPSMRASPPPSFRSDKGDAARNEAGSITEMQRHVATGVDAIVTDGPALGRRATY